MEDEELKMVAVQKAYADIILNTVKEAAARVMLSERKARCLQQDLCSVKEEALRMLLRLKNMIDSKMHEAEIASLSQRRKVEELEARLHESEDVITDLRIQLKEAQYQLKKEKKDKAQPLEGKIMNKITFSSQSTLEPDCSSPSSSELETMSSNLRNMKMEKEAHAIYDNMPKSIDQSPVSQVDIVHSHDSDSTSTVVRTKEHKFYSRKRCAHRNHALERNFLDDSLPLGIDVEDNQVLEEKEPLGKERDKEQRGLSNRAGNTDTGKDVKRSVKLHILRTSQSEKCKTGSCRPYLKEGDMRSDKNGYAPPSLMADSENVTQSSCLQEEQKMDSYKDVSGNCNGGKLKGNKNMKRGNLNGHSPDEQINPCDKPFFLSPCRTSINLVNDNERSGEDHSNVSKYKSKMKKLTCLDSGLTSTGSYVDSTSVPTSVTATVKVNRSRVLDNAANSKKELMALSVKRESEEISSLIFSSSELSFEMNPNTKCQQICEVANCSPRHVDKKMFLRCTRQSKRKRDDEYISPEKSNGKKRLGEKLKCEPEIERSDLMMRESIRESRQLSQVARQLVSLSRKRW